MRLDTLVDQAGLTAARLDGDGSVDVTAIAASIPDVKRGSLFACIKGASFDGHDLASQAAAGGAVALMVERRVETAKLDGGSPVQLTVASVRAALGPMAAAFHGHPSRQLMVFGVTGTNGKTTTVAMLASILEHAGWPALTIGSLSPQLPGKPPNTPEAADLQALLGAAVREGKQAAAMEVSSIGLAMHRLEGTEFQVGIFTNLTRDHLEFHGDMESYFQAKARLFEEGRIRSAVLNRDDESGRRLITQLKDASFPVVDFGLADAEEFRTDGSRATFSWRGHPTSLELPGEYNLSNAIAAATAAEAAGIGADAVAAGISAIRSIPGRMEFVSSGQHFTALVDYAHTPDALAQSLCAARGVASERGRLILVFGCGGDRDRAKRPLMGAIATELSDLAVLTSDNPRSEDPATIIEEVKAGANPGRLVIEADRASGIRVAVAEARPGDVVLVAGKGHETGQEVRGVIHPFDDRDELRLAIKEITS